MSGQAIGVFDSGVGGLSVLKEIRRLLPGENLIYVADSAHAPYGDKPKEFILGRSSAIVDFFLARQVKAIVVACNTATGAAVRELRERHSLPIIAMEPAIKPAVEKTQTGVIGVLATSRTLHSRNFGLLFDRFSDQARILPVACPGLVEHIEQGDLNGAEVRGLAARYLLPLLRENADMIVLGCTHYPFLASLFGELAGSAATVIDSGAAIARELNARLERFEIKHGIHCGGAVSFYSSSDKALVKGVISQLWGEPVQVEKLPEPISA